LNDRKIVLVVDDDPGMLEGLQRLLWLHAYEPILLSSAKAFKDHTDLEKAVCVILDINLGDASGIDLMHGLQAAGYPVPVICMTGNDDKLRFAEVDLTDGCLMNVRATRTLRVMSDYGTTTSGEVRARNWEVRLSLKNRPRQPGLSGPTSARLGRRDLVRIRR
jgi:CheY-like chemotaxis protein